MAEESRDVTKIPCLAKQLFVNGLPWKQFRYESTSEAIREDISWLKKRF